MHNVRAMAGVAPVHKFSDHRRYLSPCEPIAEELRPAFEAASYATHKVHRHDYYEIYVVDSGVGACQVDGRRLELGTASICVMPPGVVHAWEERDRIDGFVVRAPLGSTRSRLASRGHPAMLPTLGFEAWRVEISAKRTTRLMSLIEWIADEKDGKDGLEFARWRLCLETIASLSGAPQPSAPIVDTATAFLRLAERKHHHRWGVQDYASALNVSRATLLRAVQNHVGKSPQAVLQERVMLEARRMLTTTSLTCAEISERLGFASQAQFSRAFTKAEGASPQAVRRKTSKP